MKSYTVVIPVYKRLKELKITLKSIQNQSYKPLEIIIVNNNIDNLEFTKLKKYILNKEKSEINLIHLPSKINSGAVARNLGAKIARGEIIAFIDSDVFLDRDYAKNIISKFISDDNVIAVQGVDKNLQDYYLTIKKSFSRKLIYYFEHFFQTSFLFKKGKGKVLPSLAVTHPSPPFNFEYESEWISTCAGFFIKSIFDEYQFCDQFVTYSWNEYILLSNKLFKDKIGKMIYTSEAKYRGLITSNGRINAIALQYMAETYDLFIFLKLFNPRKLKNLLLFCLSRVGRIIYYYLYFLKNPSSEIKMLFTPFLAILYVFRNMKKIKNNDLTFYSKDFG